MPPEATTADTTPNDGGAFAAVQQLAASRGLAMRDAAPPATPPAREPDQAPPDDAAGDTDPAPAPKEPPDPADKPKEAAAKSAGEQERLWLDRMAKKDAQVHQERTRARELEQRLQAIEQQRQQEEQGWRTDPLGQLHSKGLTQAQLNERYLLGGGEKGKDEQPKAAALPPEVAREFEELKQFRKELLQREQQREQQQQRASRIDMLRKHLEPVDDFKMVSEMGIFDGILEDLERHTSGGRFDDPEEAALIINRFAHERQTAFQTEIRGMLGKPSIRAFIERELRGAQTSETPRAAHQESKGQPPPRTPARSRLGSDLALERTYRPPADERWNKDEAMRRALLEAPKSEIPV